MKNISSLHNDTIKFITGLIQKTSLRKKSDLFVVEGKRELELAHEGGFVIEKVFYCPFSGVNSSSPFSWVQNVVRLDNHHCYNHPKMHRI